MILLKGLILVVFSKGLDNKLKQSIDLAFKRIKEFHTRQKFLPFKFNTVCLGELNCSELKSTD